MSPTYLPRYVEIERALRTRVAELHADEPLPSDAQLCEEFGVSRMTARNAVQRLVQEGLVYRVPGKGTFVADASPHRRAGNLTNFTTEMRRRGRRPGSVLLQRRVRAATEGERRRLQLAAGASVVSLLRIRTADGEPVALEHAVLHARCAEPVRAADLETGSLHETLAAAGIFPTRGRATLTSERASAAEARRLDVPRGWPLLVERRLIVDQDGAPLEATETRYAAGRYALDVEFVVEPPEAG